MRALFIGDAGFREFQEPVAWLRTKTALSIVSAPNEARSVIDSEGEPRLVVWAQARPGQFYAADVERVSELAPLARTVALLGSWCEGESRSGRPWPGVERVYWHQWLARMESGCNESTRVPRTATLAESILARRVTRRARRGLAAVVSGDRASFESLADACDAAGFAAAWMRPGQANQIAGASIGLWDYAGRGNAELEALRAFVGNFTPASVVGLASFPRLDEQERLLASGAFAILAKPFVLGDLLPLLDKAANLDQSSRAA